MKYLKYILLTLVCALLISGCSPSFELDDGINLTDLLLLHNKERAHAHLSAFHCDPTLQARAQKWAESMAVHHDMTHSSLSGTHFTYMGENIAYGYGSTDEAISGWMHSKGHKANILNPHFDKVGFGYARLVGKTPYWCVQFGGN